MPYRAALKQLALAYLKDLRVITVCKQCGGQPIDWHGEHHHDHNFRPINMAARGVPLARILADLAKCEPLCRKCHMRKDGRTKIDDAARAEVRRSPESAIELARRYKVHPSTIRAIRKHPTYPWK